MTGIRMLSSLFAFSLDGSRIATGGWRTVKLWDAITNKEICSFPLDPIGSYYMDISHDGSKVLIRGKGQNVETLGCCLQASDPYFHRAHERYKFRFAIS